MPDIRDFFKSHSVDTDFDEVFYEKEYPETKGFYQPFCEKNGISDRQRLFYHFKLYGLGRFKNQSQKEQPKLNEVQSDPRRLRKKNRLAIITSFYNPCNFINLKYNYLLFSKHIRQFGDLFPVELSFDGEFFIEDPNSLRIQGSEKNCLWQKESLLNLRLNKLPPQYTDIAWIDCDILFTDPHWTKRLFEALSRHKIVQLFSHGYRLDATGQKANPFYGRVAHHPYGVTGFAWAARREVLTQINLLNNQILGGADYIMCAAFMNKLEMLDELHGYVNDKTTRAWIKNAAEIVDGSVGSINNEIFHLYHGSFENRRYQDRYDLIKTVSKDKFQFNKIWTLKSTKAAQKIRKYFSSRLEDDNLISINTYFDHVYVLNLDKDKSRLKRVTARLKNLGIQFTRFPAVDGSTLDFNAKTFTPGLGQLENKFALACRMSHLKIIEHAKTSGFTKILVFEDDVLFCEDFSVHLQKLRDLKEWRLLYFGASQHSWKDIRYINHFYLPHRTTGAFAYALHSSVFDVVLAQKNDGLAIDASFFKLQEEYKNKCFVFYPNLCASDVQSSHIRKPRDQTLFNEAFRWNIFKYQ